MWTRFRTTPINGLTRMAFVLLCALFMTGCSKPTNPTAGPSTNATSPRGTNPPAANPTISGITNEPASPRSVFNPLSGGKDPFFPRTTRLPQIATEKQPIDQRPLLPLSNYVKLTGIRPSKTRPLATINTTLFEQGERAAVTVLTPRNSNATSLQTVQVHCLEIRQDSVLVSIEGEPGVKELRMPGSP
jgi:hypothetical protein